FSTLVFSESFFACLMTLLLLAGFAAARSEGPAPVVLASILAAATVVTRPEALAATLVVVGAIIAARSRLGAARAAKRAGWIMFAVAAVLPLRAVLVFEFHDYWDFGVGTKAMANLLVGLGEETGATERVVHELRPGGASGLRESLHEQTLPAYVAAH